jgi:hypothetical protein
VIGIDAQGGARGAKRRRLTSHALLAAHPARGGRGAHRAAALQLDHRVEEKREHQPLMRRGTGVRGEQVEAGVGARVVEGRPEEIVRAQEGLGPHIFSVARRRK